MFFFCKTKFILDTFCDFLFKVAWLKYESRGENFSFLGCALELNVFGICSWMFHATWIVRIYGWLRINDHFSTKRSPRISLTCEFEITVIHSSVFKKSTLLVRTLGHSMIQQTVFYDFFPVNFVILA